MNRLMILPTLLVFVLPAWVAADEKDHPGLPAEWHGAWKGKLTKVMKVGGPAEASVMELHILPIEGRAYTWRLIYDEGEKRDVRDYVMKRGEKGPNHFVVDEQNGFLLDCWLVGGTLYSLIRARNDKVDLDKVPEEYRDKVKLDNLGHFRYELRGKSMSFEMTAFAAASPRATEVKGKHATGHVDSYPLVAVLSAELKQAATGLRDVIDTIGPSIVHANRDGKGTTWFHPRGCLVLRRRPVDLPEVVRAGDLLHR